MLEDSVLNAVFDKFWPDLEGRVRSILEESVVKEGYGVDIRSDRELLEEVLDLSRALAIQKSGGFKAHKELNSLISNFLSAYYAIFEADWEHTKCCLEDSQYFISPTGSFINPGVKDEGNNWGNRPFLLDSYRRLIDYIKKHDVDIEIDNFFGS